LISSKSGYQETEDDNFIEIESLEDIKRIKKQMISKAGKIFSTNVLKVALNLQEERVASVLVCSHDIRIGDEMLNRALRTFKFEFIYFLFASNKNQIEETGNFINFEELFGRIIEECGEYAELRIKEVAFWKLHSEENILEALLVHQMD
jgi:hypothetical protein